jgi:hypothetical protein
MEGREFSELVDSGLIRQVEEIVVDGHRQLHERDAREWSRHAAYRWLRYEDPEPVARLGEGVRKLRRRGVRFGAETVDKACVTASRMGFLN